MALRPRNFKSRVYSSSTIAATNTSVRLNFGSSISVCYPKSALIIPRYRLFVNLNRLILLIFYLLSSYSSSLLLSPLSLFPFLTNKKPGSVYYPAGKLTLRFSDRLIKLAIYQIGNYPPAFFPVCLRALVLFSRRKFL